MFFKLLKVSVSISSVITLLIGLALTAATFCAVRRIEIDHYQLEFQRRGELRWLAVNEGLDDAIMGLRSVNSLFATMGPVTREQFGQFVAPLLERYSYIQAFNFHRIVADHERAGYEAAMRARFPGFRITELRAGEVVPAATRARYNVVDYLEPRQPNANAFGFDAFSYGMQDLAYRRAVRTGLPSATGLLQLLQENGDQKGVLVIMPVYAHRAAAGQATGSDQGVNKRGDLEAAAGERIGADNMIRPLRPASQDRPGTVIGDTAVVFRCGDLIARVLASRGVDSHGPVEVRVYGSDVVGNDTLIYRSGGPVDNALGVRRGGSDWLWYDTVADIAHPLNMAGTRWRMVVSAPPVLFAQLHGASLYVLCGGVFASLLAAAYLYTLTARAVRAERLIGARTAALNFAHLRLNEDLALRAKTEKALRLRSRVIDASANAIIIISAHAPEYAIEYVNRAFTEITGFLPVDVVGHGLKVLQGDLHDHASTRTIREALADRREAHAMLRGYRKDGSMYWTDLYLAPVKDDHGSVSHFVVAQYDITEAKRYEAELEFQAKHDILTGAANRALLRERLEQAIVAAAAGAGEVTVLFVDIDRFKVVNDTLGHPAGDRLLKTLADRLREAVSPDDTVARLGGDEFVVVGSAGDASARLGPTIERILAAVSQPLAIGDHEFVLTCSIGIAQCPADSDDPDTLVKYADLAMYRAKQSGRNTFQFYTPSMNAHAQDRARLERDLRGALAREQFVLHYQPQVDLRSGRITGMEALLRWQHPSLGLLPPVQFIGLAEDTGMIVAIGAWVIERACRDMVAWRDAGHVGLRVSVNLSARQFTQKSLVQSVADIVAATGLAPGQLEIELTESLVMTDVDRAIATLHDLRTLGVTLSVDDFGTGYSSLSYLKRLPLNVLKIDRSFVRDITIDPDDAVIVMSVISLAHSLRLQVIAEGVETAAQLAFLKQHGCDTIQGFFFSPGVMFSEMTQMLDAGTCLPTA